MWKEFPKTKLSLTQNICENIHIFYYITTTFEIKISIHTANIIIKYGQLELLKQICVNNLGNILINY